MEEWKSVDDILDFLRRDTAPFNQPVDYLRQQTVRALFP